MIQEITLIALIVATIVVAWMLVMHERKRLIARVAVAVFIAWAIWFALVYCVLCV